jgi:hypothetical protein
MNAVRDSDPGAAAMRDQHIRQFLGRSLDEVEQMRRSVPQLIKGDPATWQEVRFCAQRLSAKAKQLDYGVLGACADELVSLTNERFAGAKLDERFLLSVTTAIEALALELNQLESQVRAPAGFS